MCQHRKAGGSWVTAEQDGDQHADHHDDDDDPEQAGEATRHRRDRDVGEPTLDRGL